MAAVRGARSALDGGWLSAAADSPRSEADLHRALELVTQGREPQTAAEALL
jgi:hypothetical protein